MFRKMNLTNISDWDTDTFALTVSTAIAAVIILVNIPMLYFLYGHHRLRKQKEVVIIGFVCLADLSNATAFFFADIYLLRLVKNHEANLYWPSSECSRVLYPYLFIASYQLIGASTLCITFDRLIAVIAPFRYRTFTWKYAYGMLIGSLSFVCVGFLVCIYLWFTGPVYWVTAKCYTSIAYIPQVWHYMLYFRQISIAVSIILYLPIATRVFLLRRASNERRKLYPGIYPHRKLVKTTVLIGITLIAEIFLVAMPDFFLTTNLFGFKKYEMFWYIIVLSKGIVNIFLYSFNHDEIKAALIAKLPEQWRTKLPRHLQVRHSTFAIASSNQTRTCPSLSTDHSRQPKRSRLLDPPDPLISPHDEHRDNIL